MFHMRAQDWSQAMTTQYPPDLALWCGAHTQLVAEIVAQYDGMPLLEPLIAEQMRRRLEQARRLFQKGGEELVREMMGLTVRPKTDRVAKDVG